MLAFREPGALLLGGLAAAAVVLVWWRVGQRSVPRAALALRVASVLLFGVALAQPLLARPSEQRGTVLVVDLSRSMSGDRARALDEQLRASASTATAAQPVALVAFAQRPTLLQGFTALPAELDTPLAAIGGVDVGARDQTNIEEALRFAEAVALERTSARMVLLSDGQETRGRALSWGHEAAARGVMLDIIEMAMPASFSDVRLSALSPPESAWQGGPIDVTAAVFSPATVSVTLTLSVDGRQVARQTLNAAPGLNSVTVALGALPAGYHALVGNLQAPGDTAPENNTLSASIVVRDRPRALLIEGAPGNSSAIARGLTGASWDVTVLAASQLPSRTGDLAAYDTIILLDVPAGDLSYERQVTLRDYVSKLGRGLVVSGASNSFGRGGYAGTVLESTLPVEVRPRATGQRPPVALLLVLDRSYSMTAPVPGPSRIDMAKTAAAGAVRALGPGDQIGVLTFSDNFKWVTRLRTIANKADIDSVVGDISQVAADGETQMYPALVAAVDELGRSPLDAKHIVLLSDGQPSQAFNVPDFTRRVRDAGLTMSTIAIGDSADVPLMQELAKGGNGRYSFARKPEEIPMLTLAEAEQLGGKVVATGAFLPAQASPSAILRGLDTSALPRLLGYDVTRGKPGAQVVLVAGQAEPILAQWQLGLGRVVAWTSDTGELYAPAWRQGGLLDRLVNQAARWTLPAPGSRFFQVRATARQGDLVLTVDAVGGSASLVDAGPLVAGAVAPDGGAARIAVPRIAPDRFEVRIAHPVTGAYRFTFAQTRGGVTVTDVFGAAMPYPDEFRDDAASSGQLAELATLTAGSIASDVASLPARDSPSGASRLTPVWFWPLGVGLLCFVIDIALRLGHGLSWPVSTRMPLRRQGTRSGERKRAA